MQKYRFLDQSFPPFTLIAAMTGEHLPRGDDVVRYIKKSDLRSDGKTAAGVAFTLRTDRPDETGVSVNWLGYYSDLDKSGQLSWIRQTFQLRVSKSARFGELTVGKTVDYLKSQGYDIAFQHFPICGKNGKLIDPSHSEITQLPPAGSPDAITVGYLIAKCVNCLHQAKV